jgi:hypothetical protein
MNVVARLTRPSEADESKKRCRNESNRIESSVSLVIVPIRDRNKDEHAAPVHAVGPAASGTRPLARDETSERQESLSLSVGV